MMEVDELEEVVSSLRRLRIHSITLEYDLQAQIAARFDVDGIPYSKEYRLGPRNRVDFLVAGGIGVEVKKGKPNAGDVAAQVERYCRHEDVRALVLVVERSVFNHLEESNGKPVRYVALNKLWGIAL
jgi:hypothetical protein